MEGISVLTYANKSSIPDAWRFIGEQAGMVPSTVCSARAVQCGSTNEFNTRFVGGNVDDFDSDFVLLIESDASVVRPSAWTDEFLEYDYIGAPWNLGMKWQADWSKRAGEPRTRTLVGNSGFSLRSRRFCEACSKLCRQYRRSSDGNCDAYVCITMAGRLRDMGMKFAPVGLADKFSIEDGRPYVGQFGAHRRFTVGDAVMDLSKSRYTTFHFPDNDTVFK